MKISLILFVLSFSTYAQLFTSSLPTKNLELKEGSQLELEFEINHAQFPQGPFAIYMASCYSWVGLQKVSGNIYKLRLTPDHSAVSGADIREFPIFFDVVAPDQSVLQAEVFASVTNIDLAPQVYLPHSFQGKEFDLEIKSYDLNGEEIPTVKMSHTITGAGDLNLVKKDSDFDAIYPNSIYSFSWTNIPSKLKGSTHSIEFSICLANGLCEKKVVEFLID